MIPPMAGPPSRFHLHFTPTSASWLNLVERWFALLTEKQIRRGTHRSTAQLEKAIADYLDIYNQDPSPSCDQDRRPNPRYTQIIL